MGKQKFWRSLGEPFARNRFSKRVQTRNDYYRWSSNPLLIKLFERGRIGLLVAQQLTFRDQERKRKHL